MSRGDEARAREVLAQAFDKIGATKVASEVRKYHSTYIASMVAVEAMLTFAASQPTGEMPGRDREAVARIIYSAMRTAANASYMDEHPKWAEGDNSFMQDRARQTADAILALLTPAPSATGEAGNE